MEIAARNQSERKENGYCTKGLVYESYSPIGSRTLVFQSPIEHELTYEIVGTCLHTTNDDQGIIINTNPWAAGIWERQSHLTWRLGATDEGVMESSLTGNTWKFEIVVTCKHDGSVVNACYYKDGQLAYEKSSDWFLVMAEHPFKNIGGSLLTNGNLTVLRVYDRILTKEEVFRNHLWNVEEGKI